MGVENFDPHGPRIVLSRTRSLTTCAAAFLLLLFATSAVPAAEPAPTGPATLQSREHLPIGAPPSSSGGGLGADPRATGSTGLVRTGISLALVVGLIVACAAVAARFARSRGGLAASFSAGGRAPSGILEILGRYPVSRGQTLVLLRVDRRILLLSHATGGKLGRSAGMTTLCELADPEEVASIITQARDADGESISARFRSLLLGCDEEPDAGALSSGRIDAAYRKIIASPEGDSAELLADGGGTTTGPERAPLGRSGAGGEPGLLDGIRARLDGLQRAAGGAG